MEKFKNKSANILERKNEIKELSEAALKHREQITALREEITCC